MDISLGSVFSTTLNRSLHFQRIRKGKYFMTGCTHFGGRDQCVCQIRKKCCLYWISWLIVYRSRSLIRCFDDWLASFFNDYMTEDWVHECTVSEWNSEELVECMGGCWSGWMMWMYVEHKKVKWVINWVGCRVNQGVNETVSQCLRMHKWAKQISKGWLSGWNNEYISLCL